MRRSSWFGMSEAHPMAAGSGMGFFRPLRKARLARPIALAFALVAGIAALAPATPAASHLRTPHGIGALGEMDDGTLAAFSFDSQRVYVSGDGGLSWSPDDSDRLHDIRAYQSAETPRGMYSIGDFGVERAGEDGRRELVYSTEYLRGDANEWTLGRAANWRYKLWSTRPSAIYYHADSGNLIVAMWIQGVAVETPNGRWRRVGAGPYVPTDFSFWGKTRALLEAGWLIGAVALTLSLSALTLAAAASAYERKERWGDRIKDAAFVILTASACSAALWVLVSEISLAYTIALVAILTSWIVTPIAAFKSVGGARWRLASLACALTLPLSLTLLFSFGIPENLCCSYIDIPKFALTLAALISLIPPLAYHARIMARRWRAFAPAFLGMNALAALAFAVWMYLNLSLLAAQVAIAVMVGLIAVVLAWRLRTKRRRSQELPAR